MSAQISFDPWGKEASEPNPGLVNLAGLQPRSVTWLWRSRLPLGKLVVIDGDPSTGKSTLTLDLSARVSRGAPWPDGTPCQQAGVLLLSAEDGVEDTILPRLQAAGADCANVTVLKSVPVTGDDGEIRHNPPTLPRDIRYLREVVEELGIRLVVVDVLMAYLSGKIDSHRDQDVRGVMAQLAKLAEDTDCTIILIRHLNKAGGSAPMYRGGGSIGIVGAARAAFLVARDPEDDDRRIFAVLKMNLAAEPPSLAYRLVGTELGCARVEWEAEPVAYTAADLIRPALDADAMDDRSDAARWLDGYLADRGGTEEAGVILRDAQKAGFGNQTVRRASKRLGIKPRKAGMHGGWMWELPGSQLEDEPEDDTKVP